MVRSIKKFELEVSRCTSCNVTQQKANFNKTKFSLSLLKIEISGWDQKIDKIHVHILVTIIAQTDALSFG